MGTTPPRLPPPRLSRPAVSQPIPKPQDNPLPPGTQHTDVPETGPSPEAASTVASIYRMLATTAREVNTASDELSAAVNALNNALHALSLGVESWVVVNEYAVEEDDSFYKLELGYAKVNKTWGIALSTVRGYLFDEESAKRITMFFNDAPRFERIQAVDKFPELFESLARRGRETAAVLKYSSKLARGFADAILQSAPDVNPDGSAADKGDGR